MTAKFIETAIECLHRIQSLWPNFTTSKDEFLQPTRSTVVRFYEHVFFAMSTDCKKYARKLHEELSDQNHFDFDIVYSVVMFYCVRHLNNRLGINQKPFYLSQILCPDPKEFVAAVNNIMNFVIYGADLDEKISAVTNVVVNDECKIVKDFDREVNEYKRRLMVLALETLNLADRQKELETELENLQELLLKKLEIPAQLQNEDHTVEIEQMTLVKEEQYLDELLENELKIQTELKSEIVDDHKQIANENQQLHEFFNQTSINDQDFEASLSLKRATEIQHMKILEKLDQLLNPSIPELFLPHDKYIREIQTEQQELQDLRQYVDQEFMSNLYAKLDTERAVFQKDVQALCLKYDLRERSLDKEIKANTNEMLHLEEKTTAIEGKLKKIAKDIESQDGRVLLVKQEKQFLNEFSKKEYEKILNATATMETKSEEFLTLCEEKAAEIQNYLHE